jgi:drug/metabolite transporter (DMT)-like permease
MVARKTDQKGNALSSSATPKGYSAPTAFLLLFLCASMFVSNTVGARFAGDLVPPLSLAFWRWTTVAIILTPFVWKDIRRYRSIMWEERGRLAFFAVSGMGLTGTTIYFAGQTTSALNIIVIYGMAPVLIALGASLLLRERGGWGLYTGLLIAFAGVLYTVAAGELGTLLNMTFVAGDAWAFLSAICWAVYSVSLVRYPTRLPPFLRMWAVGGLGAAFILPLALAIETFQGQPYPFRLDTVLLILFLGTVPSAGGYTLHAHLTRVLGASRTGVMTYLTPLSGSIMAYFVLGEGLEPFHLIGGGAVLFGVWLTTRKAAVPA